MRMIILALSGKLGDEGSRLRERGGVGDGVDVQDAFSCRSLSTKETLIMGLFCRKRLKQIRHLVGLRHPVDVEGGGEGVSVETCSLDSRNLTHI